MPLQWGPLVELWAAKHPEEVLAQVDRPDWERSAQSQWTGKLIARLRTGPP